MLRRIGKAWTNFTERPALFAATWMLVGAALFAALVWLLSGGSKISL